MQTYFADTWFLIALFDRRDSHHVRARRVALSISNAHLVTHDYVLSEMLAHFADDGSHSRTTAVDAVRTILNRFEVIPSNRELFLLGLDRYAARPDKEWSHVDCLSMVLMEQRGIQHVLSNDHHFSQAGFTLVNQ